MIQITSIVNPNYEYEDRIEDKEYLSIQRKGYYKEQAKILEEALHSYGCLSKTSEIHASPYFLLFNLSIHKDSSVESILNHKNDLKRIFYSRYIKFIIPFPGTDYLSIEFPNLFTNDIHLKGKMINLLYSDFLFLRIYLIIVKLRSINKIVISEFLEISEARLNRYLRDMKKLRIISENGKFVEESDLEKAGYYWNRWRHCNL